MIPISISPSFFILAGLISYMSFANNPIYMLLMVGVIFVSVLFHEFGHALTARFFGQQAEIQLMMTGGLTTHQGPPLKKWQEFMIVLDGPLFGFLLAGLTFVAAIFLPHEGAVGIVLRLFLWINVVWTLLNLLPVLPLDGGHLVRIVLTSLFGVGGLKASFLISMSLAGLGAAYFFTQGNLWMGTLFSIFALDGFQRWKVFQGGTEEDQDAALQNKLKEADALIQKGNKEQAWPLLDDLRRHAGKGLIAVAASTLQAQLLAESHRWDDIYMLLNPFQERLDLEGLILFQQALYERQEWTQTLAIGEIIHQQEALADSAILNARAAAHLHQLEAAIGWLKAAERDGASLGTILRAPEFDSLRNLPHFPK